MDVAGCTEWEDWCKWCVYADKDATDDPCFECESDDNDEAPTRFMEKREMLAKRDYEELVMWLRNCGSYSVEDCKGCPHRGGHNGDFCINSLIADAADAIEELLLENDALGTSLCGCNDLLKKLEAANDSN